LVKKRELRALQEHGYEYDFWLVRKCRLTRQCVEQLTGLLASLANSYRVMVNAAEEFNRISLAKRSDVEDAIHRASDLGEIIDDVLERLDKQLGDYFDAVCKCDFDIQLLRPGIPQPSLLTESEAQRDPEYEGPDPIANQPALAANEQEASDQSCDIPNHY